MKTRALSLFALAAIVGGTGCASMRGVEVGTEAGTTYFIEVYNSRSGPITVSYTDGTNTRELDQVGARSTERFAIVSPQQTTITVIARTSAGASLTPRTVVLEAGSTKRVTF